VFADTESGRTLIHKTPTTRDDPARGVVAGIGELCARFDLPRPAIDHVLHGTTIGTNAVLEHDGAVTGMITTAGYRDIVHIGRHQRPQHYSIRQEIPWQDRPLVQRRHRLTVAERLTAAKRDELVPLDEAAVREGRSPPARRSRRGDRGLLPVLLSEPRTRGAGTRDRARRVPGVLHLHLRRSGAAIPRVRAVYHGFAQCLCRTAAARLRGTTSGQPRRRGLRRRSACDVLQWRGRDTGNGCQDSHLDPALGAGCRRSRGRLDAVRCRDAIG